MNKSHVTAVAIATLLVLFGQSTVVDGHRHELACLSFDNGFTAPPKYTSPIYHQNVRITSNNCVYGECGYFNGQSSSRLSLPPPILIGRKRFSLSFWFRFDGSSYISGIVSGGPCPRPYIKILASLANQVSVNFADRSLGFFVAKSGWNHVVVSWDGRHARLYANGIPKGHFRMKRPYKARCPIYFAGVPYGSGRVGSFKGWIDQNVMFNILLFIFVCAAAACPLLGCGQSSSRLSLPPPILIGRKRFSLSFWFRFDGSSYISGIVSGGPCPRPYIKILASLANQVSVNFADRSLGFFVAKSGWNHVVVSWDGRHARLYANGIPKGHFRMKRPYKARCPIYFAGVPYGSGRVGSFKGWIDQICFYDFGLRYSDVKLLNKNPCISYFVKR
ncbi:hypothetical protein NP493_1616g00008 [Ridgeia piscesae]|uniref:Uncharacterized protein n=1 Tax=Ridgeia piscesae TaxID=27915 RepID=A0AAD9JX10_RIDPI|nr:hypothetical protein NP493_1616g00008 [Ridgeia piscesae]